MKKQPSVFDIEARLRENKPTPPADQKQAILANLTSQTSRPSRRSCPQRPPKSA